MLDAADTLDGAIKKLAAGNAGAVTVLGRILDDPFSGLMVLLDLERLGLRGEQIWRLYRDVHGMNLAGFTRYVKSQAARIDGSRVL